jgi:hypothetical protein
MMFTKHEERFSWERDHEADDTEAILSVELVRHIIAMPDEARSKLLAFFHSIEDGMQADAALKAAWPGELTLTLFKREASPEEPPHVPENVVPLRR